MSIPMTATKTMRYRTRRLKAGDDFDVRNEGEARLFGKMGAIRAGNPNTRIALDDAREKVGMKPISADSDDIKALRAAYEAKLGKKAFNGWSADVLREKIAGA